METITAPVAAEPRYAELQIHQVRVPKERKRHFDKSDEKTQHFIDSMNRLGTLIHPIVVMEVATDVYEVLCGRLRLWGAHQLGWKKIPAKVIVLTEEQLGWYSLAENLYRSHLPPTTWLRELQKLMAQFDRAFGADPGRAVGGLTRAKTAQRGTKGSFVESPKHPDPDWPASAGVAVAGQQPEFGDETEPLPPLPQAHSTVLADTLGLSVRDAQRKLKLAKVFTSDELLSLETCGLTIEDLENVARIADDAQRKGAVNLISCGCPLDEALKTAVTGNGQPDHGRSQQLAEGQMTDQEWLDLYCFEVRGRIQNPEYFCRDALLYRKTRDALKLLRGQLKHDLLDHRRSGFTPLGSLLSRATWINHPNQWLTCGQCQGRNQDQPECHKCSGAGFLMSFTYPKSNGKA